MSVYGKFVENEEELTEAFNIRLQVFEKEQGVSHDIEFDGMDDDAIHILVYKDEGSNKNRKAVATGRMLIKDESCKLGRIAVLKEYRKKGLGELVVKMLINKAKEMGSSNIYLNAQVKSRGFYEKMGLKAVGKEFCEANIRHIRMEYHNNNSINCCKMRKTI